MHVVRFELSAPTFALLRQVRTVLDDEHGTNLPDDAFIATLCHAVLDGAQEAEPTGRAKFQIAVTVCERCRQGWQEGAGARIAIQPAAVERAMCDAQHIGSIDGTEPERAYQDIPPGVARLVWRRDGGRCRVPGCRSSRGLELHHLVHRADGGTHDASNIALICSACHQSHHDGVLTISGTADHIEVRRPGDAARGKASVAAGVDADMGTNVVTTSTGTRAHVGAPDVISGASASAHVGAVSELDAAILRTQAKAALTGLGWKPAIADAAVAAAAAAHGAGVSLERLIFEALRRCPSPTA
jgi:HNH endonuclease/RuvA, C-terminal domain